MHTRRAFFNILPFPTRGIVAGDPFGVAPWPCFRPVQQVRGVRESDAWISKRLRSRLEDARRLFLELDEDHRVNSIKYYGGCFAIDADLGPRGRGFRASPS